MVSGSERVTGSRVRVRVSQNSTVTRNIFVCDTYHKIVVSGAHILWSHDHAMETPNEGITGCLHVRG